MRSVKFFKHRMVKVEKPKQTHHLWPGNEIRQERYEAGTGKFHEWGTDVLMETNDSITTITVGIIELSNGTIVMISPEDIQFLDEGI